MRLGHRKYVTPCAKPDVPTDAPDTLRAELAAVTIRIAKLPQHHEAFALPLGFAVVALAAFRADPSNRTRWDAAQRHVRGLVDQIVREEHQQAGTCLCFRWDSETEKRALQPVPCFRCAMVLR